MTVAKAIPLPFEERPVNDQDKLACALRELRLRQEVYPRLINRGKLTQEKADREIELMRLIAVDYQEKVNVDARTIQVKSV